MLAAGTAAAAAGMVGSDNGDSCGGVSGWFCLRLRGYSKEVELE